MKKVRVICVRNAQLRLVAEGQYEAKITSLQKDVKRLQDDLKEALAAKKKAEDLIKRDGERCIMNMSKLDSQLKDKIQQLIAISIQ